MQEDDLSSGCMSPCRSWVLRLHQHLRVAISLDQSVLDWEAREIVVARPEIAEHSEDMRIAEKRLKCTHTARFLFSQKRAGNREKECPAIPRVARHAHIARVVHRHILKTRIE